MSVSAGQAVFLIYASQDAVATLRICEGLRAAGVEVWLDQEGGLQQRGRLAPGSIRRDRRRPSGER